MSRDSEQAVLSVTGLGKQYGDKVVLQGLDLNVTTGAIHGLVGLNGSGKTTTLECLLGLQKFNSGEISVLGYSPAELYRAQGRIVALFDTPSLNPNLTVRQCLQQAQLLCPQPVRSIDEVETLLGIREFDRYKIKNLSLGNKRRASIAQALIGEPELILLDEPFNGLDASGVDEVLALIKKLNKEAGTSFLLSSHQLPYLEQVCSHIAILHKGQIHSSNTVAVLLAESTHRVLLKTSAAQDAISALATYPAGHFLEQDANGYLLIQLDDGDSAALNKALVSQDVPVDELIVQRASLDNLFRQVTQEQA